MENKNFGFIPPVFEETDYVFGAEKLTGEILRPNGNWLDFVPEYEHQRKGGLDVQACVTFGTLSALEILIKFQYNK